MSDNDTIAAISTSLGNSGIHIIRVSGIESFDVIRKIFKKGKSLKLFDANDFNSHTIHYGFIYDINKCIDEVMVSIFKSPTSYTTENVVEINCHGGSYVAKLILELIINNGARLAEPGEFSKRAFLNGRIDLSQAEAIMDIIKSQNEYSLNSFVNHLKGDIKEKVSSIRNGILHEVAFIEAALDDPEHYSLNGYTSILNKKMNLYYDSLYLMAKSYNDGRIMNEGINTVIVGKPNVGKSSILNYFLNDDKAIVTDIPGTTRDVIEYSVNIGKVNLNLTDTAGIHSTEDIIENIGIEKSITSINKADLILCVYDVSRNFSEEDERVYEMTKNYNHINIFNKCDLEDILSESIPDKYNLNNHIKLSAKKNIGYDAFVKCIEEMFYSNKLDVQNELFITNLRHVELINKSLESLNNVIDGISNDVSEDFLTIDMMDIYNYLGEIIGETIDDDLVNKIFNEFCMGK